MFFSVRLVLIAAVASLVSVRPVAEVQEQTVCTPPFQSVHTILIIYSSLSLTKRDDHGEPQKCGFSEGFTVNTDETSYGNPDLVTDMGDRFKLNYGSANILKKGTPKSDVSLGNHDLMVDEGNRWVGNN
ncbi:unnamed protein product [Rhizoctonia solani]|uniref:Pectate lyase n=1 Tax=Rhizoctonia solani TaxID=456999 RepID=A0A8H2Y5Z4_9AGAM|nr:unnamed protein product [Rhizoctonia solani]